MYEISPSGSARQAGDVWVWRHVSSSYAPLSLPAWDNAATCNSRSVRPVAMQQAAPESSQRGALSSARADNLQITFACACI